MTIEVELRKLNERLDGFEKRLAVLENKKQETAKTVLEVQKKTSLREFLLSSKPEGDVQKTLAIAFYLEKNEALATFNSKELDDAFERAREKKPSNLNDKINKNVAAGYMDEVREKKNSLKAFQLTNSGEKFVENGFKAER